MPAPAHPPLSFTWGQYVAQLTAERGGLAELARCLVDVAPTGVKLSSDPLTIERGIRRLRDRGSAPGDKYGRLLIRCFGIPGTITDQARQMGQYHSRLADLPVAVRWQQLRLWDRPPISESPVSAWVNLGLASLAHHQQDPEQLHARLSLARLAARVADARVELALLEARLAADGRDMAAAQAHLDTASGHLAALSGEEAASYLARLQDQRAFLAVRGWRKDPSRLDAALALYAVIPTIGPPFARFRRAHGRAWCLWRQGEQAEALSESHLAVRHAGDGGFVRMRILALILQGHILGRPEALTCWSRAREMASSLQDELLREKIPLE